MAACSSSRRFRCETAIRTGLKANPTTNRPLSISRFCYHQTMTIGITGPRRRKLWRGAVFAPIIAGIVGAIGLILLGLMGDFLVDWLWFSAIGYLYVFWTIIGAQAGVFFAVFVATAIILWVNGSLASRFARPADFEWIPSGVATLPDLLEFMRQRLPWPIVIAGGAGLLAVLVARFS
jgi:hypothetical protein